MNLEELTKKVSDLEKRIEKIEQDNSSNTDNSVKSVQKERQQSIVEFLKEKNPTVVRDKALVFAVYYEKNSNSEAFGTEDLLTLWRQAKEPKPANINDLINQNVKKGFMAEESKKEKGKKRWYVTSTGLDVVDKGFTQE